MVCGGAKLTVSRPRSLDFVNRMLVLSLLITISLLFHFNCLVWLFLDVFWTENIRKHVYYFIFAIVF